MLTITAHISIAYGWCLAKRHQPYKEQFFVTNLGESIEKT
jgi:hypothetical protein